MVLNAFANDRAAVEIGGALAGDRRSSRIAEANHFGDASGSVVRDDGPQVAVCFEEAAALREGDRMRLHSFNGVEVCAGTADQVLFDLHLNFIENIERA